MLAVERMRLREGDRATKRLAIVLSLVLSLVLAAPALAAPPGPLARPNLVRVLVRFAGAPQRDATIRRLNATARGPVGRTGFEVLELDAPSASEAAATLARETGVLAAEPDARVAIRFTPNDPYYLRDPFAGPGQWALRAAHFDAAWDVQRGLPQVVVATIDTGVDTGHPDLVDALVPAPRFVSAPDQGCPADTTDRDDNGHGTHVAGIIGASAGNGIGVVGAAFGVRVMAIKALDCTGSGFLSDVATAVTYAVDNGARVINISLAALEPSDALASAVRYALDRNVLVVAAAGNCGAESGTPRCPTLNVPDYPAAYDGVLAVGATDADDRPASFSTSAGYVGIGAPGTNILSTFPTYHVWLNDEGIATSSYAILRGTSQAAPFVSAAAALVLSKDPSLPARTVAARLRASADDVGAPGYDARSGDGRLNVERALVSEGALRYGALYRLQEAPQVLAIGSTGTLRAEVTNTSNFTWRAGGAHAVHVATHWYTAAGRLEVWDSSRATFRNDVPPGATVGVDVPLAVSLAKGAYVVKLDVVEEDVAWFSTRSIHPLSTPILVNAGFDAEYVPSVTALALGDGSGPALQVTLTNTGPRAWPASGPHPVYLSSHVRDANGALLLWDGPRAAFAADVVPGGSVTISLPLSLPREAGTYAVQLDLVEEGVTWFSQEGVASPLVPARVIGRMLP